MESLKHKLEQHFANQLVECEFNRGELTIHIEAEQIIPVCKALRDEFGFTQLIGFSRAREPFSQIDEMDEGFRYAVVYHLLSVQHNNRLRLKVDLIAETPIIDSVTGIWHSADWYEREAFDLFGILFKGHADLRRILTDYGFVGHPFRKDFPLIGNVEMLYDPEQKRVIYQPVSIEPRTLVPRVIRDDNRYLQPHGEAKK